MDRTACVNLPALPLQILLRSHPDWRSLPVAVVDRDKPNGTIQWINKNARHYRITRGMRYGTALSLCRELRAGVVTETELTSEIKTLTHQLSRFSPRIEPSAEEPGVFWLDAAGLRHLYPSLETWGKSIRNALHQDRFIASVTVGYSRFGTYATSRACRTTTIFTSPEQEQQHLRSIPIEAVGNEFRFHQTLQKLGVQTLGGFIDLPAPGIRKRFGPEAQQLHRQANGQAWSHIDPATLREPIRRRIIIDYPDSNIESLLTLLDDPLQSVIAVLQRRHELLTTLHLTLILDDKTVHREQITPAAPTNQLAPIIQLVRLRLDSLALEEGVIELRVSAKGVAASERQTELFAETPKRNLLNVEKAFSRIRAELGNDAIQVAHLQDAHLPEASFTWEPLKQLRPPSNSWRLDVQPLIRRLYDPPIDLPQGRFLHPDKWNLGKALGDTVTTLVGPHIHTGHWWSNEYHRTYYFAQTKTGRLLWVYSEDQQWFIQGEVQ